MKRVYNVKDPDGNIYLVESNLDQIAEFLGISSSRMNAILSDMEPGDIELHNNYLIERVAPKYKPNPNRRIDDSFWEEWNRVTEQLRIAMAAG